MSPERLLGLFERISEAPDAIARLRRLVLELAIRGKLVEQDASDEPAIRQLGRIADVTGSDIRVCRTALPASATTPKPFLPQGWAETTLSDLVTVVNGRAYSKSELLEAGTPVLRVGNLFTSKHWYYSNLTLEPEKYCEAGDLIFAWSASFGPFIWQGPKVIYHYHIWKLPLHSDVELSKLYLHLFLRYKTAELKMSGHGVSMTHLTKANMERLPVPVPPLAEQRRIVEKVDELMALCDRLESGQTEREARLDRLASASLHHLNNSVNAEGFRERAGFYINQVPCITTRPEQIKQLRHTILSLAVNGKLVPQNRAEQPTAELLTFIKSSSSQLSEPNAHGNRENINLVSKSTYPIGWAEVRLGAIITLLSGQHLQPGEYSLVPGAGIPYITGPADFGPDSLVITRYAVVRRAVAKAGQILVTVKGAGIGKTAVCDLPEVAISRQLMAMTAIGWSPRFLLLTTHQLAHSLKKEARSLIPGISREDVNDFRFALPPLAEQHRIVARVDELMGICDQLERSLTKAQTERSRLLESVLHETLNSAAAQIA